MCLVFIVGSTLCGCAPTKGPASAPSSHPVTTRPTASITIEIAPNQKWPRDIQAIVHCDAPPAPEKFTRIICVRQAELAAHRQLSRDVAQERRKRTPPTSNAQSASTTNAVDKMLDPDAIIWLVVAQKVYIKPRILTLSTSGPAGNRPNHRWKGKQIAWAPTPRCMRTRNDRGLRALDRAG